MNYTYIDESGSEGTSGRYIVFASITVSDPRPLEKAIKKLWRAKPQFHALGEFHATDVDDATRKRILLQIANLPLAISYKVIDKRKQKIPISDAYYVGLADFIDSHNGTHKLVVVDKKDTDKRRTLIIRRMKLEDSFRNVSFEESHRIKQLQAVDFVAWSLGRMYEHNDSAFYDLVKHKESPLL